MEIIEILKNRRSIIKVTDNERKLILDCLEMYKSKTGKDESYEIDKLKYNVIDQNEIINISKLEANTIREILHKVGAFSEEINTLINGLQRLLDLIGDAQSTDSQ
jgi:hypothetical protein